MDIQNALNHCTPLLEERGLSKEAIAVWQALQQRERFAAQVMQDPSGTPWQVRDYQRGSIESRALRKIHCDGRDVGKTAEIEIMACWAMATLSLHLPSLRLSGRLPGTSAFPMASSYGAVSLGLGG